MTQTFDISKAIELALQHHQSGQLGQAEQLYNQILKEQPQRADILHSLGIVAYQRQNFPLAVDLIRQAIQLHPGESHFYYNLGLALKAHGQFNEAFEAFQKALALKPDHLDALNNLGSIMLIQDRLEEALQHCRQAITLAPTSYQALNNMGVILLKREQWEEAGHYLQKALNIKPDYVPALTNMGMAMKHLGQPGEAIVYYQKAFTIQPNSLEVLNNIGTVLEDVGQSEEAILYYRKALTIQPDSLEVLNNIGSALKDQGQIKEALLAFEHVLKINPNHEKAFHNWVYIQQFLPESTLKSIQEAHQQWNKTFITQYETPRKQCQNKPDPRKKLVLGFVSGDFRHHPVAYFTLNVLEQLAQQCDLICYANQQEFDDFTARFQAAASQWHNVHGWSDQQLAEQIRGDQVDILFDLTGHNARNRLGVFAQKPAPIQMTWAGYMATTGLETMDYIIGDPYEIPEEAEQYYQEQVIRMPHCFICYTPYPDFPDINPLPALQNAHITFGSLNILSKISPEVVATWSAILNQLPESRIILKTKGLACPTTHQRYLNLFHQHGISASRITCYPHSPRSEAWPVYQQVDIQLDPFPFSGSTTTLESLWMGVPVITMPGETFASRHSFSYLSNIGLTDFIAQDREYYIHLAVDWGQRLSELSEIRQNLRTRVHKSPLYDAPGFAQDLLKALRKAWTRWCQESIP
jgi:protein O-GlcNAc transferase